MGRSSGVSVRYHRGGISVRYYGSGVSVRNNWGGVSMRHNRGSGVGAAVRGGVGGCGLVAQKPCLGSGKKGRDGEDLKSLSNYTGLLLVLVHTP